MPSETLSIRVPAGTKTWLERLARGMGSAGSAAARLIEEARRREIYRAVEFRDTSLGRLAYVSETRVPVHFAVRIARDGALDAAALAEHFSWAAWKAESVLAYGAAFVHEIDEDIAQAEALEDPAALSAKLPGLEVINT
jgi:hypothetical protein